jgi:hypothetical protein
MEADLYRRICALIDQVSPHRRRDKQQFGDHLIAKVYLYSVLKDRSVLFACDPENWDKILFDELINHLPSQSTMSRRMRTVGVLQTLERAALLLGEDRGDLLVKIIDSKPLRVGNYSKDRDAKRGRASGAMARGYKLHAISQENRLIHWTITSMNTNDQIAAQQLIPRLTGGGYLLADNAYDANKVHVLTQLMNHQLVAPPRMTNQGVRDARRNSPARLRSLDMLNRWLYPGDKNTFGQSLLQSRGQIERSFGHAVMLGMNAPPPWVRTPRRIATWVSGKLIQSMLRLREIEELRR